jgi:hypothetical protein
MPPKKSVRWTSREVRELIVEMITFQNDNVQGSIMELCNEIPSNPEPLSRDQAARLVAVLEPTLKDAAFKVLASKKL